MCVDGGVTILAGRIACLLAILCWRHATICATVLVVLNQQSGSEVLSGAIRDLSSPASMQVGAAMMMTGVPLYVQPF